jgi:hypothetical protein
LGRGSVRLIDTVDAPWPRHDLGTAHARTKNPVGGLWRRGCPARRHIFFGISWMDRGKGNKKYQTVSRKYRVNPKITIVKVKLNPIYPFIEHTILVQSLHRYTSSRNDVGIAQPRNLMVSIDELGEADTLPQEVPRGPRGRSARTSNSIRE